jgi:hypothetical protein
LKVWHPPQELQLEPLPPVVEEVLDDVDDEVLDDDDEAHSLAHGVEQAEQPQL